jgi:hypothetical protein
VRPILALALVALAAGCGGADGPAPVDRADLLGVFAGIDEPLALRLDMRRADSGSPVDSVFVPASADVPDSPVEVNLFDNEDGARANFAQIKRAAGAKAEIVLHKNVVMLLAPSLSRERRDRLVDALKSA